MGKGRAPCCDKTKVKRGPWSPEEDLKLTAFIRKQGHTNWRSLPKQADLLRCGKSCRLRWLNYLKPDIKRGNFTKEDEDKIIELHHSFGNKWSKIALSFPGRTDNEIKNVWNTHLKKRLTEKEIVHISNHEKKTKELSKPSSFSSSSSSSSCISNIYQNENQELGEGAEGKNQENGELIENLCPSFSTVATSYSLNADLIDVDIMQTEDTGFLISDSYQDNYEMFFDPNYGVDIFPLDTEFEYLEMLDKEDPICSYQSQANDIEVYQRNIGEENERENECMKWMKNLENEFLLETRSGEEPDYFNFWL